MAEKKLNGTVIVTYRCNARCSMCNRYKAPSKAEEEISIETIKKLPKMYFTNITLNMISLSGLALGVGMLVDNSIVVIENIYRLRNKGISAARAAVMGANQVAGAIAASTLTTICVFLPIVFTTGLTRELFTDMALTIAYSLIASLIVALTVVPSMSVVLLKNTKEKSHRLFDKVLKVYDKVLRFCLKVKLVPLALAIALLVLCVVRVLSTGMIMMPEMGGSQMSMTVNMPDEMKVTEGYAVADELMEKLQAVQGIETVGIMSGGGSGDMMLSSGSNKDFTFFLLLDDETGKNNTKVAKKLEKMMEDYPQVEYSVATSNMDMSALTGDGLTLNIYGDDLDTLLSVSEDMKDLLSGIEGFENIENGQSDGDRQLVITVDKDKAMRLGLTVAQIYGELSGKLTDSKDATTLTTADETYQVTIVDDTEKLTEDNLMAYTFETTTQDEDGKSVKEEHKLSEFAKVSESASVSSINRENQERYISVTADTMEGYNTTLLSRTVEDKLGDYDTPEGYRIEIAGESTQVMSMMHDMLLMITLAIIFIYLIMVAQFQSLLSPFIVLFTIPLAFTGGFLGLMLTGEDLSMIAMMGFLILAGVVVNNGIVFVDYTNKLRIQGLDKRTALIVTGKTRMRPILMTALTTILSMSVMVFSQDAGNAMQKSMAIVVAFGLLYATLMTLFIVPVMYDILYRKQPKEIDVGSDLDEIPDETSEYLESKENAKDSEIEDNQ